MAEDTDHGTDLAGVSDLEITMREISGRKALAHRIARRLQTPRGGLFYDPDFGYDLRQFVSGSVLPEGTIEASVENEALKDEGVEDVQIDVRFFTGTKRLRVFVAVNDSEGGFDFVLDVTDVTVELLTEEF